MVLLQYNDLKYCFILKNFLFFTLAITSNTLFVSPATIPAATAASIPFRPFVLGTITLLTF